MNPTHESLLNATEGQRAEIDRLARPRKRAVRVTARKHGGDDAYSWAIFVDGRVRLTGLHRSEVDYYRRIERERIWCD